MAKCTGGFDDDIKCYKDDKTPLYKNKYFWIILIIITIFTVGVDKYKAEKDIKKEVATIEENYNKKDYITKDIKEVENFYKNYDEIVENWQKLLLDIGNNKLSDDEIVENTVKFKDDFRALYISFDGIEIDNLEKENLEKLEKVKKDAKKSCIDFSLSIDKLNKLIKNNQYNEKNQKQVKEYLKTSKNLMEESREGYKKLLEDFNQ
ncbi:MAG: hypothetical protein GX982_03965 [Tissierellia bacterium]|nr:hypothetical protein [Tissierellia bacterium]